MIKMKDKEIEKFKKIIMFELNKQFFVTMGLFGFLVAAFINDWNVSSILGICKIKGEK